MPAQKTKRVAPKQASYFEESVDLSNNYAAYPQDLLIDEDVETLRKPPPSIEEEEESNLVHFLGLVANLILVLGFASYQSFAVLEFDGRDRGTPANATYVTAFTCFFTSAMIELVIDVVLKRTFAHGRYTNKKGWNVVISTLFIVGTTLDITAFFLWNQRKFTQEHRVLYAAGHFWLVTAILVLWAEGSRMIAQMKKCGSDGLDGVGNLLFLVGALMDCIVRYMDIPGTPRTERPLAKLEFSSSPIWLASAVFYVIADLLRSKKRRRTQTTQNLRTFEEKYENRCGWTGRAFVGVLTIGALSCSLLCALSCDFIAFESITGVPDDELEKWPPYDGNVLGAEIGIFSYRITESKNDQQNMETCEAFSDLWKGFEDNGGTTLWVVAQFCAVFAVVFGVLGGLTNLMDCCCRPSRGCFPTYWIPVGFSFLAFGCQSCTFLMLMDTGFCFNPGSPLECRLEVGGWYSIASLCSYFACTVLICCLPKRTEPILNLLLKKDEDIQRSSSVAQKGGEDNGYENNADMEAQTTPLVPVVLSSKATPEKQSSKHVVAAPEENSEIESLLEKKSSTSSRPQDDPTETKPESVSQERPETTAFTAATTSDSDKLPQNKQPSTKKMKQTMKSDSRKHDSDEDTDDTETANRKYLEQIIRSDRGSIDENNDDGSVDDGDRGGIEENNDDDNRRGGLDSVDDELEQLQARLKARHKELGVILDDMSDINSISNLLENDEPSESDNAKPVLVMNKPEPNQTAKKATPKNPEVIQINQNSDTPLNELLDDDDTSSASSDIFVPVQTKATAQASRAGKQQLTKDTDLGPARHNHVSRLADLLDDDESYCSDIFVPVQKNGPTQQSSLAKQPLSNHAKLGSTNQKSESRLADLLDDDSSSASSGNFVPAQKQESPQISLESKQRPPKDTKLGKTETNARDGGDNALASSERIVPAQKQPPPQKALAAKQRPSKDTKLGKDSGDDVEHSEQVAYKSNSDSSTKSNGDSRGHIHSTSSWKSTSSFVNPHTGDGDFPDTELKNKPTRDVQSFLVPITPMLLGPMTDVDSSDDDSDDLFVRLEQIQSEQLQKKQQKQASKPAPTKKQTYVAPTRNLDDKTTTKSNNTMTRRPQQQQKQLPKSKEETTSIMAQQQKELKLKPTEPMSLMARLQQQQQQQQQLSSKSRAPPVNKKKPPHKNSSSRSDSFYSKASASKPAKQKNASSPTNVMARLQQQQQQQQQWQQEEADSWVPKHYSPRRPNMSKFGTRVSPSSEGSSNAS